MPFILRSELKRLSLEETEGSQLSQLGPAFQKQLRVSRLPLVARDDSRYCDVRVDLRTSSRNRRLILGNGTVLSAISWQ